MRKCERVIVLLLVLTMITGMFTACKGKQEERYVTRGEWIATLASSFGMTETESTTPYFSDIKEESAVFTYVQASCDWGILPSDSKKFKEEDYATLEFVVTTAVLAIGGIQPVHPREERDAFAEELFQYAADHKIIEKLDYTRKLAKRRITLPEAMAIIDNAKSVWLNPQYEEKEQYTFNEGVQNFASEYPELSYEINEADHEVMLYEEEIPLKEGEFLLKKGDIYVLPADEKHPIAGIYKVDEIEYTEEGIKIKNVEQEINIEEVIQELSVQNSFVPDFTNCPVTDGTGKLLEWESDESSYNNQSNDYKPVYLGNAGKDGVNSNDLVYSRAASTQRNRPELLPMDNKLSKKSVTLDFSMDKVKIKGKIDGSSVNFTAELKVNDMVSISKSYELKDFYVDGAVDFDWGILQSARASYSYALKESSKVKFGFDSKNLNKAFGQENSLPGDQLFQYLNQSIRNMTNITGKSYVSKSVLVATIPTPLTISGLADVAIEIRLGFTLEGSVELIVSTKTTQGIEYRKGSGIRTISEKSVDSDIKLEAKMEAYLYVGVVLECLTANLVDVAAEVGIGGVFSTTLHLLDYTDTSQEAYQIGAVNTGLPGEALYMISQKVRDQSGMIKVERCTDKKVYFIFRITAGNNSLIGKVASITVDICGKDQGPYLMEEHHENGQYVGKSCTLKFRTEKNAKAAVATITQSPDTDSNEGNTTNTGNNTKAEDPEDKASSEGNDNAEGDNNPEGADSMEEDASSTVDNNILSDGSKLDISAYMASIKIGGTYKITIDSMPEGYDKADVEWMTSDAAIVTVSAEGLLTGISEGSAIVTAKTKDAQYEISCSISVYE